MLFNVVFSIYCEFEFYKEKNELLKFKYYILCL